jgi:hypothetical protein
VFDAFYTTAPGKAPQGLDISYGSSTGTVITEWLTPAPAPRPGGDPLAPRLTQSQIEANR